MSYRSYRIPWRNIDVVVTISVDMLEEVAERTVMARPDETGSFVNP